MVRSVFLYVPNLIGYARLTLLFSSCLFYTRSPMVFLALYSANAVLDVFDGIAARKLNQCSAFGAWFDVVIDNIGRGMLWSRLYQWGCFIAMLEWLVFVCTHSLGARWKVVVHETPWLVRKVMEKNFKTPTGTFAILGLHGLPIWMYAHYTNVLSHLAVPKILQYFGIAFLSSGRALCFVVEVFFIWSHILCLVAEDDNSGEAEARK
ncbi:CDP-diacylglycerol--inositol 3-phosphatidyltransferase-like isoform X1 [Antedon mediterranea]|uniref:CDP-diacylglycerol--inositol 3-phosphatidyltransferase-like isoform X1 n=1 Tax=Antedon mediterranea TaxID=105859 RepID=UPI003AF49D9C